MKIYNYNEISKVLNIERDLDKVVENQKNAFINYSGNLDDAVNQFTIGDYSSNDGISFQGYMTNFRVCVENNLRHMVVYGNTKRNVKNITTIIKVF